MKEVLALKDSMMRIVSIIIMSASVAMACGCAFGAVTVTASRDYVDRKSTLHPSSNEVEQVGYFLGTQTNKVLASKGYVDSKISSATPGDYYNVSNAAMNARGKSDLAVYSYAPFMVYSYNGETLSPPVRMNYATIRYAGGGQATGWISEAEINGSYYFIYESLNGVEYLIKNGDEYSVGSGDPITISSDGKTITNIGGLAADIRRESTGIDFATGDRLATTGQVAAIVGDIKSDRITDGTNIIDAARNVVKRVMSPWMLKSFGETNYNPTIMMTYGLYHVDGGLGYYWISEYPFNEYGDYLGLEGSLSNVLILGKDDEVYFSYNGYEVGSHSETNITSTDIGECYIYRDSIYYNETVGKLALTNDIPPAVSVVAPSANAASGTAADAKATGTALYTGFTEWEFSGLPAGVSVESISYSIPSWYVILSDGSAGLWELPQTTLRLDGDESYGVSGVEPLPSGFAATRHLVTPTKTSQLTNDGDGTNVFATVNIIDASNATFSNAVLSVGIGIDANTVAAINALVDAGDGLPIGGATTVGALLLAIVAAIAALKRRVDDKASVDDLPYALVTPGEWEWIKTSSGGLDLATITFDDGQGVWHIELEGSEVDITVFGDGTEKVLEFTYDGVSYVLVDSLHLLDRANNLVSVSANTTLTLPPFAEGKMRDLLVRLTVSATSAVTWTVAQSESWDAMGAPPSSFAAGAYLYHITEVAPGVWHAEDMLALVGLEAALAAINGGVAS